MQVMDFEPDIATWGIPAKHGYPQNRELETELLMKDKSAEFSDTVEFDREADVFCRSGGKDLVTVCFSDWAFSFFTGVRYMESMFFRE